MAKIDIIIIEYVHVGLRYNMAITRSGKITYKTNDIPNGFDFHLLRSQGKDYECFFLANKDKTTEFFSKIETLVTSKWVYEEQSNKLKDTIVLDGCHWSVRTEGDFQLTFAGNNDVPSKFADLILLAEKLTNKSLGSKYYK